MAGNYFGYDGPCPPWNDERLHHYVFTLYALDAPRLALGAAFSGAEARQAMQGRILAQATLTGLYSLNPALRW
jgi:Raf kinase inhibitor-like YbhB/YbcL family protein